MAHISGYGGSVVYGTGDAPAAIAVAVEAWSLNVGTETHEARAKAEAWKTKFAGASDWTAQIVCLTQDDAADGLSIVASGSPLVMKRTATDLKLRMTDTLYLTGSGFVETVNSESPVDGPSKSTYGIMGTGPLVETVP